MEIRTYLHKMVNILKNEGLYSLIRIVLQRSWLLISLKYQLLIGDIFKSESNYSVRYRLVIFTGVPFDDIGGGQRAAQLARTAIRVGYDVLYVYLYPKYSFSKKIHVSSFVSIKGLSHKHLSLMNTRKFIDSIDESSIVIFEMPHPEFLPYLRVCKTRGILTVYELIDEWETSLGGTWFDSKTHAEFVKACDLVAGTAKTLVKKLNELGRADALYLPNAANEYIFDYYKSYKRPKDLPKGDIFLYFGSLYGEWFGWEYIVQAAKSNPQSYICLIGDIDSVTKREIQKQAKNVIFLGPKKVEDLPKYIYYSKACLLPFRVGQISESVSPIKVFEYLFMNKPVISTPIAEVKGLPNVFIADTPDIFAQLVMKASELKEVAQDELDDFISKNSWLSRLQSITSVRGNRNVSVIILIHNNKDIIIRCLRTLLWHCSTYLAEVIVVDNKSEDNGGELVKSLFPNVLVLENSVNGCASGRNLGAKHATAKTLAFFDSDQWFTSAFGFEEALNILRNHANLGAISWGAGWLDNKRERLGGMIVDYLPKRGMIGQASSRGFRTDIAYLATSGMFVPHSIFEATGGFDTYYDPTTFEDTDLSFSIKKLGFDLAYRDLSGIRHQAHSTTYASEMSPSYLRLYSRNAGYFMRKWKSYPSFFVNKY